MAPYKVQIIQDWPELWKVKDIQSFLRFANFYRCFIYGYSEITIPLTHLTRKGAIWHFSNECRLAFDTLKRAFTTALVLTHWIPDTPLQSRLTPLTMLSPLSFPLRLPPATYTWLHSIPEHFTNRNATMTFMTKSSSQFLKPSNVGDITLRALEFRSTLSPITGTSNTFPQPRSVSFGKGRILC